MKDWKDVFFLRDKLTRQGIRAPDGITLPHK